MTRRDFLAAAPAAALAKDGRPNVLFLSVDDMNDWVGCLGGYPGVQTPNIDRLAHRGVLFSNAHCASPLCNPSRTALLTGLRSSTTGIYNNDQYWRPALPDVVTLPQYFMRNGYHVAGAGKVFHHTAGFNPPDQWHEFQLQEFDDPWYRRPEWYPWNKKIPAPKGHPFNGLNDFPGEFDWGVLPWGEERYGDTRAVEWASKFLERKHEKPFFMAVGLWHPHIPMFAPQNYFDLYPENKVRLPELPENDLDDVPAMGQKFAAFRRSEHERIVREGKWKGRYPRLPGEHLVRRCHGGQYRHRSGTQLARAQYDPCFLVRQWLAPGREAALAQVHALAAIHARAADFRGTGLEGSGQGTETAGQSAGSVSDSG